MCVVEIHNKDIFSINKTMKKRIKGNEDQNFCFCGDSEKSRFEWLHKEPFKNFLEPFY